MPLCFRNYGMQITKHQGYKLCRNVVCMTPAEGMMRGRAGQGRAGQGRAGHSRLQLPPRASLSKLVSLDCLKGTWLSLRLRAFTVCSRKVRDLLIALASCTHTHRHTHFVTQYPSALPLWVSCYVCKCRCRASINIPTPYCHKDYFFHENITCLQ